MTSPSTQRVPNFEITDEVYDPGDGSTEQQRIERNYPRRIRATRDFTVGGRTIKKGEYGGFVSSYDNLDDESWVADDAFVTENAHVGNGSVLSGNAGAWGNASVFGSTVGDDAKVFDQAGVFDSSVSGSSCVGERGRVESHSSVSGNATVRGGARVTNFAKIEDGATVAGTSHVADSVVANGATVSGRSRVRLARVLDNATIDESAVVGPGAVVHENARVTDNAEVKDNVRIGGNAAVGDRACVQDSAVVGGDAIIGGTAAASGEARIGGNNVVVDPRTARALHDAGRAPESLSSHDNVKDELPGSEDAVYPPLGRNHAAVPDHHIPNSLPPSGRYHVPANDGSERYYQVKTLNGEPALFEVDPETGKAVAPVKNKNAVADVSRAVNRDPETSMAEFGRGTGVCGRCGRSLSDPASQAAGLGPNCRHV